MRIRTIKPEFFKHDELAELPPLIRLLFVGLWCVADCAGRLEDRPARIKAEVLPYDKCDVVAAIELLTLKGFVTRYQSGSLNLIQINNFRKHQRITGKEAETPSKFPAQFPSDTNDALLDSGERSEQSRGNIGETPETTGREGKGKEGKGKDNSSRPKSSTSDGDDVSNGKHPNLSAERFVDWFVALLTETGAPVPKLTPANRFRWADTYDKLVRLDGHPKETIKAVCRWARSDKFWKKNFLSPAKLRDRDAGVMLFDSFLNKMGGYTPPREAPPAIAEPAGWQAYIDREFPACPWAAGSDSHGVPWEKIPRENQQIIVDDMAKNGGSAQ